MESQSITQQVLASITEHYLNSRDFNGIPAESIALEADSLREVLTGLVRSGHVSINFGDRHPNPHINAFKAESGEAQLEKLTSLPLEGACLYPTPEHLRTVVDLQRYVGRPFRLRLALGAAQLDYLAFDLRVLEQYRNDPRYHYETNDIQGWISVKSEFYESDRMRGSDQVLLEYFGFGYDSEVKTRVVVAFVRDLDRLSPEHQQMWDLYRLDGEYRPHPDFWAAMMGSWDTKSSIFAAFVEELRQINAMSVLMGRPPLFRSDFADERRPKKFGFLIRPTLSEFNAFVLLLDKMISENIDPTFFMNEVEMEQLEKRKDGIFVAKPKGSLSALSEWIKKRFRPRDPTDLEQMLETFRRIRKMRQKPAHAIDEDVFDQEYFRTQRQLIVDAYKAIRTLRLIFANHPKTKTHQVPDWLYKGEICSY